MSHHPPNPADAFGTRRDFLCRCGMGMGGLALGSVLGQAIGLKAWRIAIKDGEMANQPRRVLTAACEWPSATGQKAVLRLYSLPGRSERDRRHRVDVAIHFARHGLVDVCGHVPAINADHDAPACGRVDG